MGEVWLAVLQGAGTFRRRVVVKVLAPERRGDARLAAMLADEARIVGLLHHPGIVSALDYLETEEHGPIFVLEFVDGASLRTVLKLARKHNAVLPEALAAHLGAEVAHALHAAHTALGRDGKPLRVVHRDVAPDNVLLSRSGAVYLGDFGVARSAATDEVTQPGVPKGKRGYMAPEQAAGRGVGPQSDIFSLGRVVAEAADVSCGAALRKVLEKATAPDWRDRYATASELAEALLLACPQPFDPDRELAAWLHEHAPEALVPQKSALGVPCTRAEPVPAGKPSGIDPVRIEEQKLFASVPSPSRKRLKVAAAIGAALAIVLPLALLRNAARGERIFESVLTGMPAPSHGDLRVTCQPLDAEVYVDGRLRGMTPVIVELPVGEHQVRVGSPRMSRWRAAQVDIKDNTEHLLDVDLTQ